ncbi:hypothetical protein MRX96_038403 [Rhipicephalus microplus]
MITPTSGSSGQPEIQPLDGKSAPVNSDDSAHDDHNKPCRQEQGRAPPERPRIHTNMKEAVDRSTGESLQELGTIPNSPGETRQVGVRQEDNLPDNTMDLSATGPEAPPRPNDDAMKQERRHSKGYAKSAKASRNTHSQILLVGDGNVPRVARALQRQLGPKQNLQTCWTQHATVKCAQELLHQCIGEPQGEAGRCRRLVVLLVGATDAIRGTRPEDVVQVIRDSVALYAERLVICSVPEVTTRGKVTLARAITLNAQLRKMCSILRAIDVLGQQQAVGRRMAGPGQRPLCRRHSLPSGDPIGNDCKQFFRETRRSSETRQKGPEEKTGKRHRYHWPRESGRVDTYCLRRLRTGERRSSSSAPDAAPHASPASTTRHHQTPTGADGPPENRALGQSVPCGATIPGDAIKRRDTTSCPAPAAPALEGQHTASIPNPTDGSTAYWTRPGSNDSRHGPALHEATTSPMTFLPCRAGHEQESFRSGEYGRHCGPEDIRPCRSKCHRRRAKWQCFRLGFLNMHGARREQQWGELYNALRGRVLVICSGRDPRARSGRATNSARLALDGSEHIWSESQRGRGRCVMAPRPPLATFGWGMQRPLADNELIVIGDFNEHLSELDGHLDANGKLHAPAVGRRLRPRHHEPRATVEGTVPMVCSRQRHQY